MRKPRVHSSVPTSAIEWIVGRLHVGASDDTVRAELRKRIDHPAAGAGWSPARIREAEAYAVWVHHRNKQLYSAVMGGRL